MSSRDDFNAGGRASSAFLSGFPTFASELAGTLAVQSQYVLHGNIRDQFLVPAPGTAGLPQRPTQMLPLLWQALVPSGYECLVCYDPVDGISVYPGDEMPQAVHAAERILGPQIIGHRLPLEVLRTHLARVVGAPEPRRLNPGVPSTQQTTEPAEYAAATTPVPKIRAAFIIEYAARITRVPGQLDPVERDFFLYCQKLALTAKPIWSDGPRHGPLYNPIIWLVEGERDLPAWLTAGVEPIRTIAVGMPTLDERMSLAHILTPILTKPNDIATSEAAVLAADFAKRTDGMTLQAMMEIVRLSKDRGIGLNRIADAIRIYKLGVDDNPWRRNSVRDQITLGERTIGKQIIGQDRAINKTLDILKRAALGLSGAQATTSVSRPRGVLFFAGPTGVGKTETAKRVADILFGDPNSYLRFDMSEFAADHSADRLIGAPPGYIGFEAGGELTGAVRRKPFQVILFDEIEKAHPLVLDKFLQILEDGRLTDGQGITTHFSECVLIFTSNLGTFSIEPSTGERLQIVKPGMPYDELESTVRSAIRDHFANKLGRPELLNRLGDNIVVFDFIGLEIAHQIFHLQLRNIVATVHDELGVTLTLTEEVTNHLARVCTGDISNGGRGIGNLLESNLINPLARYLFEEDCQPGATVVIASIRDDNLRIGPVLEAHSTAGEVA